jgi:hypothetical protein
MGAGTLCGVGSNSSTCEHKYTHAHTHTNIHTRAYMHAGCQGHYLCAGSVAAVLASLNSLQQLLCASDLCVKTHTHTHKGSRF